ncbi:MAG: CAP domain-containing protein [Bacteroidota bacterium]
MRKVMFGVFALFTLVFGACKSGELLSTTNQPEVVPRKITATSTTTEKRPDGTVVTMETKSVSIPVDENGVEITTTGPDIVSVYEGDTLKGLPPQEYEETTNAPLVDNGKSQIEKDRDSQDFLTPRERSMVNEINQLRNNPSAYIGYIEDYKRRFRATYAGNDERVETELAAADELIRSLRQTPALDKLLANRTLYELAKQHGSVIKRRNYPGHIGLDGSYPWERIKKADPTFGDGAENIVAGLSTIRDAIIVLLIDSQIPERDNRKALLNPSFTYVACYEIGEVNGTPYTWLQEFASVKEIAKPEAPEEELEDGFEMPSFVVQGPNPAKAETPNINWENSSDPTTPAINIPDDRSKLFTIAEERAIDSGRRVTYLSELEKEMLKEINRARMFPKRYAVLVQDYINEISKTGSAEPSLIARMERSDDLIKELNSMNPVGRLDPYLAVQRAGKKHLNELEATENLTKIGGDGTYPWDRLAREDAKLLDGNENILYGYQDVREAVIVALLDINERDLVERSNILNPGWTSAGINQIEKVGKLPYVWVQTFAVVRGKNNLRSPISQPAANMKKPRTNSTIEKEPLPSVPAAPIYTYEVLPEERLYDTGKKAPYLTNREREMIFEINRVRANPRRYVRFIQDYKENYIRNNGNSTAAAKQVLQATDDLLATLNAMTPVSILQPNEAVYQAGRKHGLAGKQRGRMGHIGADGSYPWDRIQREDPRLSDGNENLIAGPEGVREALLLLLIDSDFPNRGHRHNILRPDWVYVAAIEIGDIGSTKNNWIQNFAK